MSEPFRPARAARILALLAAALVVVGCFALGVGPSPTGWRKLLDLLAGHVDAPARTILLDVRLPRILLAAAVGAALSGAGAAFQAVLRNPLADPYILGVSGGAALGAALFIAFAGLDSLASPLARPAAAFAGALLTLFLLFRLARVRGRTESLGLLLVGVILNAFDSAVILFLLTAGDPSRFQGVIFYLVGSIGSPPWPVVAGVTVIVLAGLTLLFLVSHRLNLLASGEEGAAYLGVDVERTTWTVVIGASIVTAAAVAFTGLVGFVGLIVPHAFRLALGPDHRLLIPGAALAGGAFLLLADSAARTVLAPVELPVGVITALVGGPFFVLLFVRRMRES